MRHTGFDSVQIDADARTLGASVTHRLRLAITRGELMPGQPLGQEDLAQRFGVSRVPIRDSLKQLAAEGLVDLAPYRGAVVAQLSLDELDELYGIIWSLEALCVEKAVPLLGVAELARMAALIDEMEREARPSEWYALSVSFHSLILVAAGRSRCVRIVDECRHNVGRYLIERDFFATQVPAWRARNRKLFEACRRRDTAAAIKALDVMRTLSTGQIREHLKATQRRRPAR
ncbi:GntR family transcriptional regulator [Paucibacter sp. R3-3]|uniref:GntR family transcriptional regulator n=2 Tax=Roseateles agri TaxID=3098619 RepID=A0ABU5DQY6_9BURK|nr:GntR family transcriptional regulator [Paucibacter sp. R3-3]